MKTFVLFHPGEMGVALGAALASPGYRVLWASQGRSPQTATRAKAANLEDACTIEQAVKAADVVVSVCPPHAALVLARESAAHGFGGIYVDANAISPATAREIGTVIEAAGGTFVDGGIIGPPPTGQKQPTLYLSGALAVTVAALFTGTNIHAKVIEGEAGAASALKMCYAAFTKGTTALLAAVRTLAEHEGGNVRYWNPGSARCRRYSANPNTPPLQLQRHGAGRARWRRLQRASQRLGCPKAFTLRRPRSTGVWKASRIALHPVHGESDSGDQAGRASKVTRSMMVMSAN